MKVVVMLFSLTVLASLGGSGPVQHPGESEKEFHHNRDLSEGHEHDRNCEQQRQDICRRQNKQVLEYR